MRACACLVTLCLSLRTSGQRAVSLSLFICVAALNLTCACSCITGLQWGTKVSMRHSESRPAHVHAVPVCPLYVTQAAAGLKRRNKDPALTHTSSPRPEQHKNPDIHTVGSHGTNLHCSGPAVCQPHCLCCTCQSNPGFEGWKGHVD